MIPIWKDTYYTSTANTLEYYITDGTNTIFRGKSYKFPDRENIKIKINDICSNHLNSDIPLSVWSSTTAGSVTLPNAAKTFTLYNEEMSLDFKTSKLYVFLNTLFSMFD